MNLLFICSRNQWRSPTAEHIFRSPFYHTKSAGTSDAARIKVTESHISWANLIFVMEKKHRQMIIEKFRYVVADKRMIVLHIEDEYQFMEEALIEILEDTIRPFLNEM